MTTPSTETEVACKNCRFWVDESDQPAAPDNAGSCRINEPSKDGFPFVTSSDWCGKFERRGKPKRKFEIIEHEPLLVGKTKEEIDARLAELKAKRDQHTPRTDLQHKPVNGFWSRLNPFK